MTGSNLYLHYTNSSVRGPGQVVKNLIRGLTIFPRFDLVEQPNKAHHIGCLQHPEVFWDKLPPEKTLIGPNVFVVPENDPALVRRYQNFVVPSNWVKNIYALSPIMHGKNIYVWPVGIDTDDWRSEHYIGDDKLDCFVYFKNRRTEDLEILESLLRRLNLKYEVLCYGSYTKEQLKLLCKRSKFCILLTGTESQGIAYMNILSTNTPCFVFNTHYWFFNQTNFKFPATSVPYFNEACGFITDNPLLLNNMSSHKEMMDLLYNFKQNVDNNQYSPRDYILDNHTALEGARRYTDIIVKCK